EGRSQSNSRVSTYMRNLEGSGWMTRPDLSIIEARDGVAGLPYVFNLSVQLANPNAPRDEDGDGIPDPVPPVDSAPAATAAPAEGAAQCARRRCRCGNSTSTTWARGPVSTRSGSAC